MIIPLANASSADPDQANVFLVALCLATLVAVGCLAVVVIVVARRRNPRGASPIAGVVSLWAIAAVGSGVYTLIAQLKWSNAHAAEMLSGYGDPNDLAPPLPYGAWSILAAGYLGLLAWAVVKPRRAIEGG